MISSPHLSSFQSQPFALLNSITLDCYISPTHPLIHSDDAPVGLLGRARPLMPDQGDQIVHFQAVHQRIRRGTRYRVPCLLHRQARDGQRGVTQARESVVPSDPVEGVSSVSVMSPPTSPGAPSSLPSALIHSVSSKRKSKYTSTFGARLYLDYGLGFAVFAHTGCA